MTQLVKNPTVAPAVQETWVWSLGGEDPLEEGIATHSQYACLENPHGQRTLAGCNPWGHKESDMAEWLTLSLSNWGSEKLSICLKSCRWCQQNWDSTNMHRILSILHSLSHQLWITRKDPCFWGLSPEGRLQQGKPSGCGLRGLTEWRRLRQERCHHLVGDGKRIQASFHLGLLH